MQQQPTILVYEEDRSVLASLQFALALEGYRVIDGSSGQVDPALAACLVIEQRYQQGGGLALLAELRTLGCAAPAVLMVTNPTGRIRLEAQAAGVVLIEKPLLTDDLTPTLRTLIGQEEAAA